MNTRSREIVQGTVLDERYQIRGVIGYGGFSTVYEAVHVQIERVVAIKVLDSGLEVESSKTAIQRFLLEARAAARIDHPNVVAVHDVGITPTGHPYIVMQRFEGETLRQYLLHHGGIEAYRILPLFIRCLDGLAAAHQAGIVHRDLKPQNLVMTDPGSITEALKIIDFGTVQLLDDHAQLTAAGHLIGTMAYLSPEYVLRKEVSAAMDVYQMGLVLVEALWGRRVVRGDTPLDYARVHIDGELDIPEALLDCPLGHVLGRALSINPEGRYADAAGFARALMEIDPGQIPDIAEAGLATEAGTSTTSAELVVTTARTLALATGDIQLVEDLPDATVLTPMHKLARSSRASKPQQAQPADRGTDRGRMLLYSIAGGVIALIFVASALVLYHGAQIGSASSSTPADVSAQSAPPTATPAAAPPAAAPSRVEISSTPSTAAVFIDGNHVGSGRATLMFMDNDKKARRVEVRAKGFVTQVLSVNADSAPKVEILLTPAAPEPTPKPVARPPAARPADAGRARKPRAAPARKRSGPADAKPALPAKKKKNWKLIE